jgi:RNA polymerase sigma-70 factor (ECF subfamily)
MPEYAVQPTAADEAELVERARRSEHAAIRLIIKQQNRRLYRIARSIVRDDSDAEDVLQEAYVRAFGNLDAFRGEARIGTWLARIVINEALACLRRRRRSVDIDRLDENAVLEAQIIAFPNASHELDPETTMAQREIRALFEHAIDELPKAFRAVLVARLVEGMSVEETAELFGILPQTVKTRLHRARALLKRKMEQHIGPVLGGVFPFAGRRCNRLTENVLTQLGLC